MKNKRKNKNIISDYCKECDYSKWKIFNLLCRTCVSYKDKYTHLSTMTHPVN